MEAGVEVILSFIMHIIALLLQRAYYMLNFA